MALSTAQLQQKIRREVGLPDNEELKLQVEEAWEQYEDRGLLGRSLRYLYAKRDALNWILGQNWKLFNWVDQGVVQSDSDRFKHLTEMLDRLEEELVRIETSGRNNRVIAVGTITAQNPLDNPYGLPDPNSRIYRGDAVLRRGKINRR
jgi:hypothetical protein